MSGPVLETERLVLRPHVLSDFDDSFSLWSDPETVRHIGGRPATEEEVWRRLMRYAGFWSLLGFGFWVARERDGRGFVGEVGFGDGRRGLGPAFDGAPEAGWAIAPSFHGRGLAAEATAAALDWNDRRTGGGRTVCLIHPDNAASIRMAERVGFRRFKESRYKDAPTVLFERP